MKTTHTFLLVERCTWCHEEACEYVIEFDNANHNAVAMCIPCAMGDYLPPKLRDLLKATYT